MTLEDGQIIKEATKEARTLTRDPRDVQDSVMRAVYHAALAKRRYCILFNMKH